MACIPLHIALLPFIFAPLALHGLYFVVWGLGPFRFVFGKFCKYFHGKTSLPGGATRLTHTRSAQSSLLEWGFSSFLVGIFFSLSLVSRFLLVFLATSS